jgi:hypothetical protein
MTEPSEFPCWIGCDQTGPLAFNWEEVRLVEVADDASAAVMLDDSEWLLVSVDFVPDAGQFFRKLAKVLALRAIAVQSKASTAAT